MTHLTRRTRLTAALAVPAALAASLFVSAPTAAAGGDEPNYAAILEQKAPSIVTVKFVLKVRMSMGGQSQDEEQNADARGVVVDPAGLVMVSSDSFEVGGGMFRRMRGRGGAGIDASSTPTQLKVVFGSEEKEHDAVLAATEKKLGLAFVQLMSPEGMPAAIELGKGAECKVGQWLVAVARKGRGFDSAPYFSRAIVAGKIEKPRPMWAIEGTGVAGLPLFNADGQPVGVVAMQQGVEGADEGAGRGGGFAALMGAASNSGLFLLPLDVVAKAKEQAKKKGEEAVAKAKEEERKAKEDAAGKGDEKKEPGTGGGMDGAGGGAPPTPETPKAPDTPK